METAHASISPKAPFDFELTAGYHTYFQGRYGIDSLDQGVYRRLLDLDGRLVLASVRSVSGVDAPELSVELEGSALTPDTVDSAVEQIGWLLGVHQDLTPFYRLAQQDPTMEAVTARFYGLHLPAHLDRVRGTGAGDTGPANSHQRGQNHSNSVDRDLWAPRYLSGETGDGETFFAFPGPKFWQRPRWKS